MTLCTCKGSREGLTAREATDDPNSKLTYYHAGRFKQLSQFGGEVIQELIA